MVLLDVARCREKLMIMRREVIYYALLFAYLPLPLEFLGEEYAMRGAYLGLFRGMLFAPQSSNYKFIADAYVSAWVNTKLLSQVDWLDAAKYCLKNSE